MRGQVVTLGIVLQRTNFQEADRIVTLLTPDNGKIRLVAKGVRKVKSKLAGGIELFSISDITFIPGKSELGTLVSSRLKFYFNNISSDIDRTMVGYELLKRINKATEDAADKDYFELLSAGLEALDNTKLPVELVKFWFLMRLLNISGHAINAKTNSSGKPLVSTGHYSFDQDQMAFEYQEQGAYTANHIKLIALAMRTKKVDLLAKVSGVDTLIPGVMGLVSSLPNRA